MLPSIITMEIEMSNKAGSKWIRPEKRQAIYHRDDDACVYCGVSAVLTLDHVTPRVSWLAVHGSESGMHHESNLITACLTCNSSRADQSIDSFCQLRGFDGTAIARRIFEATQRPLDMAEGKKRRLARKEGGE